MTALRQQIDGFLAHLVSEKRYAARTIGSYREDLALFAGFLARQDGRESGDLGCVTMEDLRAFVAYLERERGNSASTQARRIAALRSLFNFAEIEGWIAGNPARRLATPKLPRRRPVHLTASDSRELLGKIEAGNRKDKVRNLAHRALALF